MKLSSALLCYSCDELVPLDTQACPSCTDPQFVPLSVIVDPMSPDGIMLGIQADLERAEKALVLSTILESC